MVKLPLQMKVSWIVRIIEQVNDLSDFEGVFLVFNIAFMLHSGSVGVEFYHRGIMYTDDIAISTGSTFARNEG